MSERAPYTSEGATNAIQRRDDQSNARRSQDSDSAHCRIGDHRWASRLTLQTTAIRVERLQDISDIDGKAEGIRAIMRSIGVTMIGYFDDVYRRNFAVGWNALDAKRGSDGDVDPGVDHTFGGK